MKNKSNSVSLYSSISSNISVDSEQIINTAVASGDSPKIPYTPGLAPDVISIDLGNDRQQETTKPLQLAYQIVAVVLLYNLAQLHMTH